MQTGRTTGSAVATNNGDAPRVLRKRHAPDDSNFDFERFSKRLNLLSIAESQRNGNSNRYIPVASEGVAAKPSPSSSHINGTDGTTRDDDHMHVDDTRNRVYIHDLDAELADLEPEEEKLIFLPDIEKYMSKVPRQMLTSGSDVPTEKQELVLYGVPKSLTVDEGHDSVRRAIVEARQRAREKAVEDARHEDMSRRYDQSGVPSETETAHGYTMGYGEEPDPDAMDLG